MIGAMAVISTGISNSAFHSGVFNAETAKPMTQVPSPFAEIAVFDCSKILKQLVISRSGYRRRLRLCVRNWFSGIFDSS